MTSTMLYEALTVKPPTSWSSGLEPNTQLYSNMSVYGEPVNILGPTLPLLVFRYPTMTMNKQSIINCTYSLQLKRPHIFTEITSSV